MEKTLFYNNNNTNDLGMQGSRRGTRGTTEWPPRYSRSSRWPLHSVGLSHNPGCRGWIIWSNSHATDICMFLVVGLYLVLSGSSITLTNVVMCDSTAVVEPLARVVGGQAHHQAVLLCVPSRVFLMPEGRPVRCFTNTPKSEISFTDCEV